MHIILVKKKQSVKQRNMPISGPIRSDPVIRPDPVITRTLISPYVEENSVSAVAVNSIQVVDPQLEGSPKTPLRQNYSNFMDISENSGKNNK